MGLLKMSLAVAGVGILLISINVKAETFFSNPIALPYARSARCFPENQSLSHRPGFSSLNSAIDNVYIIRC
jgi:hypothetical protein